MINKIVAIQGNHPSKLNPASDTSIFLANEIQSKNYKIFYYDPKDLSIINSNSRVTEESMLQITKSGFSI